MIAAESGSGKTFLAFYIAAASKLRTIYFSADADERTMRERATAMVTGERQETVRLDPDNDEYLKSLAQLDRIRWVFESDPTYEDIEQEVAAYTEAWGDYPETVVVDNLMNVVGENEDEYGSLRDTTRLLHWLCRHAGCAVLVLHHMREEDSSAREFLPARKGRLQGKVSNFPEVILSIALDEHGQNMLVAPVKNRFGRQDKSGKTYVTIPTDLDRAQFYESDYTKSQGIPA